MLTKEISPEARGEQLDHRFRGRDLPARALAFVSAAAKASGRTQLLSCALEIADVLTQIEADDDALAAALIVGALPKGEIDMNMIAEAFGADVASLINGVLRASKIVTPCSSPERSDA